MKILISDDVHPILIQELERMGHDVSYQPLISLEECKRQINQYQGLVINSKIIVDQEFLTFADQLKWIARLGSGLEIIDLNAAYERGIEVFNSPEGNRNAVAEHALGMLLTLFRNIHKSNAEIKNFDWRREENRGIEIEGKKVGMIGFGHTGSSFAKLLEGFGCDIIIFDKYKQLSEESRRYQIVKKLEDVQRQAEIISLHLPLTEETKFMIDADFFNKCDKEIYLINTSRGKIVNTRDLIEAISSRKVRGACLDVFENEKVSNYSNEEKILYEELFSFKNVICSPHIAGWTHESKLKIAKTLLEKLEPLLNVKL
ncbi:MAG: hypothetical protein IPP01_00430 [Saprospiraceae bacterium]|nr:hypothetical protein [Saprospiraceae bacterium]